MTSALATTFVPLVLILMTDGTELQAVGDNFLSYDACMLQGEADAKAMAREAERLEANGFPKVIEKISIVCEPMEGMHNHRGYLPLEEYSREH